MDIEIENTRLTYTIYTDRYADIKAHRDMHWQRHRQGSKVNCDTERKNRVGTHEKAHIYRHRKWHTIKCIHTMVLQHKHKEKKIYTQNLEKKNAGKDKQKAT